MSFDKIINHNNIKKLRYPSKYWVLYSLAHNLEVREESKDMFIDFIDKYNIDRVSSRTFNYIFKYGKKRKDVHFFDAPDLLNGDMFDHGKLFATKDNKRLYISHPYKNDWIDNLNEDIPTIESWCKEKGLTSTIYLNSWYYPGKCYCIVFEPIQ